MHNKILLVCHVFPREIDDFDHLANQLKVASKYISNLDVSVNIILNLNDNIIDWKESKIPAEYFVTKFNHILKKFDWCKNLSKISYNSELFGFIEQRVSLVKNFPDYHGYLFLDSDIIIDDYVFYFLENSLSVINEEKFIVSPQMYKFWDASWNVISLDKTNLEFDVNTFDSFSIKTVEKGEPKLVVNKDIKFAGGWFTYISKDLFQEVPFPPGISGYGAEDSFIARYARSKKYNQYIMEGTLVQENRKYLNNIIYTDLVKYNTELLKAVNDRTKYLLAHG